MSKAYVDRYAQFVLKPQKPIQPYICSTLSDFQEERDFLADYIFPQLNELCNSQGTYFKAVDLRWSALKAPPPSPSNLFRQHSCLHSQYLKLCLDYVNSCFPFFICMLGQTYGDFLPDHVPLMLSRVTDLFNLSMVEQNLYIAAKNGYPWVLENPSYSLMEFEVIQAAFLNESPFQYFYFRTGTMLLKTLDEEKEGLSSGSLLTDEEKLRIGKLKAKIIRKGLRVRFYKDLHELGDLVFKDWSVVIEQLYPATLMIRNIDYKHNCERFYHEEFESNRTFEILERFALQDVGSDRNSAAAGSGLDAVLRINPLPVDKSILLLSGERGCGKSTLIANWVNYFKKKYPSMLVIPHFVGTTCESSNIMSVMHCFITELQFKNYGNGVKLLTSGSFSLNPLPTHYILAALSLKTISKVVLKSLKFSNIFDFLHQAKDFSWLPCSLPPHCKFIMGTVSSSLSYKLLCARPDVRTVEFISIGDKEVKLNIFRQHLSIPNKDPLQQSQSTLRKKTNPNPLKLTILANELRECRIYRDEYQCLKEYLEVVSVQELWELILKRWIEDYSWTFTPKKANSDMVHWMAGWPTLCAFLSISHCGLAEDEIFQLLDMLGYRDHYKVTMLHWAAFHNASRQWVQEKPNGLLYFRHQSLQSAVEHKLLGVVTPVRESRPYTFQNPTNHKKTHFHRILVQYFQRQTTFSRVFEELPWHLKMSGSWGGLCSFLSNSVSKIQHLSFWTWLHLIHYWNVLAEVRYDAAGAYLLTVAKVKAEKCHKMRKRHTPSVLECRLFEVTTMDKCQLMFFIAKFLKLMGKINEAEGLFLTVENMLVQVKWEINNLNYFSSHSQQIWSWEFKLGLSDPKHRLLCQNVFSAGRVLNNLVKSASEKYLKENHILECATETSSFLDNNPCDQATMKYTEGVLIFAARDTSLAKMRLQECLNIRRSLFGEKNILVGEIMEFLADLLSFLPEESERCQRKQAIEYYKQVIRITENAGTFTNSSLVRKQLSISLSDTLCKLTGQLFINDSGHHVMTEAVGYLYRSLDLRATYLGSSHSSIHGILLLREIEGIRSRRCWLQGMSQQYFEGSRNGTSLCEYLLKLDYHGAQSSNTVSSAICMNAHNLQRVKSMDLAPHIISEKSKCASGKGKKVSRPIVSISVEEKTRQKTQDNVEPWNDPGKGGSMKKKDYSSKVLSLSKMDGVVKVSQQKVFSAKGEGGKGQITTIYRHPLAGGSLSTNNPWESISDSVPQKSFLQRRSQFETKLLKTSNDTNKV
uniref:Tetratricopeptide repeat domain 41 n=1 Tax=Lynx canadensis TaxID=61383 RepID=A0A667G534_LYNCA